MQTSQIPTKVPLPFASSGTKNAIPTASQIGITPGAASLIDGFPPLTMTPLSAGGVPPSGADFNGILNLITAIQQWQSAGGSFKYDSAFATAVSGYPKGALLMKATNDGFWINTVDGNTTNPDSGGTGWNDLIAGAFVYVTSTGGYIKFPGTNAPVLQWGTSSCLASQTTPVTFAPAFANACLAVIGAGYNVAGSLQAYVTLNGWSKTGFTYNAFYANSGSVPALCAQAGGVNCIWLAIGY